MKHQSIIKKFLLISTLLIASPSATATTYWVIDGTYGDSESAAKSACLSNTTEGQCISYTSCRMPGTDNNNRTPGTAKCYQFNDLESPDNTRHQFLYCTTPGEEPNQDYLCEDPPELTCQQKADDGLMILQGWTVYDLEETKSFTPPPTTTNQGCELDNPEWTGPFTKGFSGYNSLFKYHYNGNDSSGSDTQDDFDTAPPTPDDPVNHDTRLLEPLTSETTYSEPTTTTNQDGSTSTQQTTTESSTDGKTLEAFAKSSGLTVITQDGPTNNKTVNYTETIYTDGSKTTIEHIVNDYTTLLETTEILNTTNNNWISYQSGGESGTAEKTITKEYDANGEPVSEDVVSEDDGPGNADEGDCIGDNCGEGDGCPDDDPFCMGPLEVQAPAQTIPNTDIELPGISGDGQALAAACPIDKVLSVLGADITIKMQPFCTMAAIVKPFLLAAAWLLAALLVGRGIGA